MSDVVDLSEHMKAQTTVAMGGGPRDPMTGSDLDTILQPREPIRSALSCKPNARPPHPGGVPRLS
jgi:hypothetical protein